MGTSPIKPLTLNMHSTSTTNICTTRRKPLPWRSESHLGERMLHLSMSSTKFVVQTIFDRICRWQVKGGCVFRCIQQDSAAAAFAHWIWLYSAMRLFEFLGMFMLVRVN